MTFEQLLLLLQGAGIGGIVGAILAFLAEKWPYWPADWYHTLDSKAKPVVFYAGCLVLPMLSALVGCLMGYQVWGWEETFWPVLYQGGLAAFGVGTLVHSPFIGRLHGKPEAAGMK